jgi:hypothetical protein
MASLRVFATFGIEQNPFPSLGRLGDLAPTPAFSKAQNGNGGRCAPAQNVPKFEVDPTWPQTLPSNWIIGTIGGITVDAQDHIWINQRPSGLDAREKRASTDRNVKCCVPAPPVIEFDQAGKVVQGWGGDGPNYKWGNDGHGIHGDHNNFVWVGDNVETTPTFPNQIFS